MSFVCGACASTDAFEVFSYPAYPIYLVPLPQELARDVPRAPLTLAACRSCGHFQIPSIDAEVQRVLYEVYYTHYEVDVMESMAPAYREPFNRVLETAGLPGGRLLEIGCSSGAMVPTLEKYCESYTGVDPSERIEIARTRYPQHRFIRSYFPSAEPLGAFDVAVTQFNLEHIPDVSGFVAALGAAVRSGGMLVIQVPDAGYFLRTGQPNFLAHEHVHYFRRPQLTALLRRHGFEPEVWGEQGASLICAARRTLDVTRASLPDDPLADARTLSALVEAVPDLPAGPVLYGVGLTLHWLLSAAPDLARGSVVVDDNPGYRGKGVPGYDLPIDAPSSAVLEGRSIVLTLNAIYHEPVLDRLRSLARGATVHRIVDGSWSSCTL